VAEPSSTSRLDSQSGASEPGGASVIRRLGAADLARRIAAGELSSREAVEAFAKRIAAVNGRINAIVVSRLDEARREAEAADSARAAGGPLGPLLGVPITVKECFHLAGTPATIGLSARARELAEADGWPVARLRQAGAIVLGKTNVPQLMLNHETDNPHYGRTNNPWDIGRTPGGSTGGEAALIAAGGSPLGLGSDLGGSIRIPAHFCGIHGLKPTSHRLPKSGSSSSMRGLGTIDFQFGPLARRVEDLSLAMRVLAEAPPPAAGPEVPPLGWNDPGEIDVSRLRFGYWTDDGWFAAAPAAARAVEEAAQALRERGGHVERFDPPDAREGMRLYFALMSADGTADMRRLVRGSKVDWRNRRLMLYGLIPRFLRPLVSSVLHMCGQRRLGEFSACTGALSADQFWQATFRRTHYVRAFVAAMADRRLDAFLCPPHALPALRHGQGIDLLQAASYAMLPNLLGLPAGVVAATRVRPGEESNRSPGRDLVELAAQRVEKGSAGLPIGVQVCALPWREDVVLAAMGALEEHFAAQPDYPARTEPPI
jgi:fatty acid amide hydrolase